MTTLENDPFTSSLGHAQYVGLVTAALVTASASLLGSSAIIMMARRKLKDSVYHRLLVAISVGDILFTVCNMLHPFLMPRGTSGLSWAFGNVASCSAMGFAIIVFPMAVAIC